jgi:hypothetical protein
MSGFISLDRISHQDGQLVYEFESNLPFFRKREFFIRYDRTRPGLNESVNAIPFAAVMAPVAWASGAELRIPLLDREFAQSLDRCRDRFRHWFSNRWSFGGRLKTSIVSNVRQTQGTAMLFSGGLDSMATYVRHRDEKPALFTIFGADIPVAMTRFIDLCKAHLDAFAQKEGATLRYIQTDIRDILDFGRLKRFAPNWYGEVAHGLLMSSLIAPVGYDSYDRLLIASCSHRPGCGYACGSDAQLMREVRLAGMQVASDSDELSRCRKIALYLKDHEDLHRYLRVCWMQFESLNCGRCEKCLRTICELLVNGIDPERCNFKMSARTLLDLKKKMISEYYLFLKGESTLDFWRDIQASIRPEQIADDRYGSREFFGWFAGFKKIQSRQNPALLHLAGMFLDVRAAGGRALTPVKGVLSGHRDPGFIVTSGQWKGVGL